LESILGAGEGDYLTKSRAHRNKCQAIGKYSNVREHKGSGPEFPLGTLLILKDDTILFYFGEGTKEND